MMYSLITCDIPSDRTIPVHTIKTNNQTETQLNYVQKGVDSEYSVLTPDAPIWSRDKKCCESSTEVT